MDVPLIPPYSHNSWISMLQPLENWIRARDHQINQTPKLSLRAFDLIQWRRIVLYALFVSNGAIKFHGRHADGMLQQVVFLRPQLRSASPLVQSLRLKLTISLWSCIFVTVSLQMAQDRHARHCLLVPELIDVSITVWTQGWTLAKTYASADLLSQGCCIGSFKPFMAMNFEPRSRPHVMCASLGAAFAILADSFLQSAFWSRLLLLLERSLVLLSS